MRVTEDSWLSNLFGCAVFKVEAEAADAVAEKIAEHQRALTRGFYYSKVDTADVSLVKKLEAAGFNVVDVNVTFALNARAHGGGGSGDGSCRVVDVDKAMAPGVLDIAGSCFKFSRFHLDPRVPRELAHRIKREWIANYAAKKRGEGLYVAVMGGRPAGFLAVIGSASGGRSTKTIDLIGVAPEFQGKGVGKALVRFFIETFGKNGDELTVGTQAANVSSMRLYEKCGFSVAKTAYVLHKHVPA